MNKQNNIKEVGGIGFLCGTVKERIEFENNYLKGHHPIAAMCNYREDRVLNGIGQNVTVCELDNLLNKKDYEKLAEKMSCLFQMPIKSNHVKILSKLNKEGLNMELFLKLHKKNIALTFSHVIIQWKDLRDKLVNKDNLIEQIAM